jgi:hypothetical protein
MVKTYFSLREANEFIKKILPDVNNLIDLNEQIHLLNETKIEFDDENMENFLLEVELNKNFHEKNIELYSIMGFLIRQGCVIRDLDDLEIDFFSKFGEKEILFCWKPSEDTIKYWHMPGEDMTKRKPITQIKDAYLEQLKKMK